MARSVTELAAHAERAGRRSWSRFVASEGPLHAYFTPERKVAVDGCVRAGDLRGECQPRLRCPPGGGRSRLTLAGLTCQMPGLMCWKSVIVACVLCVACNGNGDLVPDAGRDGAPSSPVRLVNLTPRLTDGAFQCQANTLGEFIDCADYQFSFVIENNHDSAAVQRVDGMRWEIGSASASSGDASCETEPWGVPPQSTSSLIDVVFIYTDGRVGGFNGFHYPCAGGTGIAGVRGLMLAIYSGDMTFGIDVTLGNGEFHRIEATAPLIDAT